MVHWQIASTYGIEHPLIPPTEPSRSMTSRLIALASDHGGFDLKEQLKKVIELAQATPQVVECHRVTGEDCFVLKAYLPALSELDELLDRFLVFGQTTTSLIQSTPVPLRELPLPNGMGGEERKKPRSRAQA